MNALRAIKSGRFNCWADRSLLHSTLKTAVDMLDSTETGIKPNPVSDAFMAAPRPFSLVSQLAMRRTPLYTRLFTNKGRILPSQVSEKLGFEVMAERYPAARITSGPELRGGGKGFELTAGHLARGPARNT